MLKDEIKAVLSESQRGHWKHERLIERLIELLIPEQEVKLSEIAEVVVCSTLTANRLLANNYVLLRIVDLIEPYAFPDGTSLGKMRVAFVIGRPKGVTRVPKRDMNGANSETLNASSPESP